MAIERYQENLLPRKSCGTSTYTFACFQINANVRRSYRLDSSTASAIAAQRNRESSAYWPDNASLSVYDPDVVVVYRERTAL